jgi:peptide subunit release factor 1 (eRF1)
MPPAHPGNQKTRGSQRDVFEQRIEAQYAKFFRDAANRIRDWADREKLSPVAVAGPSGTVEQVWAELPTGFVERALMLKGDFAKYSEAELFERVEPDLRKWKRAAELRHVEEALAQVNGRRAVAGLDETLQAVQQGAARALLVARGLGGKVKQCVACHWTDRAADPQCQVCGADKHVAALRAVLPELARKFGVQVEVVAGEAGSRLRAAGGLAAWLR